MRREGRTLDAVVSGDVGPVLDRLRAHSPESLAVESLSLEEIFVAAVGATGAAA